MPAASLATLADCRNQLFVVENIVAADDFCAQAVANNPADGEARFFRALTRILRVLGENTDGADPARFTDSVKEMMDQFGIGASDRSLYSFAPTLPKNSAGDVELPSDSPDGNHVQEALSDLLLPAISASVDDLRAIATDTAFSLSASELATVANATGVPIDEPSVQIDFGDVELARAGLLKWKSHLLTAEAHNLSIDLDSYTPIEEPIRIQNDIVDTNPQLLTHSVGAACSLFDANIASGEAVEAYLAGSDFIRAESDSQDDDLITIEPDQLADEAEIRTHLTSLLSALECPTLVLNEGTTFIDEARAIESMNSMLATAFDSGGAALDLGLFYDAAFPLRDGLPLIGFDEFESRNFVASGSFPDATFQGTLLPVSTLITPRECPVPPQCLDHVAVPSLSPWAVGILAAAFALIGATVRRSRG
jgi:hypothetical protein